MKKTGFSIVIPLYQKQDTIGRAIRSVLAQTYPYFELIVVDDGSTDCGADVVTAQIDGRIKFIRQLNEGVSAARNAGIEAATCNYVAFLDADDEWTPFFLENIVRLIELYPGCGWYSTGITIETCGVIRTDSFPLEEGLYHNYFEIGSKYNIINSSDVVIPTNIAKEVGGFPVGVKAGEDLLMWVKIASKYPFAYTPESCSIYHYSEKNNYQRILPDEPDIFFNQLDKCNPAKNEFLASEAIHRGILHSIYGNKELARSIERNYAFTQQNKRQHEKLKLLNRVPSFLLKIYYELLSGSISVYRKINPKK